MAAQHAAVTGTGQEFKTSALVMEAACLSEKSRSKLRHMNERLGFTLGQIFCP
jgi:hypothetical protein